MRFQEVGKGSCNPETLEMNQQQPGEGQVPEAPPPYEHLLLIQPIGVTQPESYPGWHIQPSGMSGVHPTGQIPPPAPRPHQNPTAQTGRHAGTTVVQIIPKTKRNNNVWARKDKYSFHTNERVDALNGPSIVEIRGSQNELIMVASSKVTGSSSNGGREERECKSMESKRTITFKDTTGKKIMTCEEIDNIGELTVRSGGRVLGKINGVNLGIVCCGSSTCTASNNGGVFFETSQQGSQFLFSNGITVAKARKGVINGNGDVFGLEFLVPLDSDTKLMALVVSYYLFVLHYAETSCCGLNLKGILALNRCIGWITLLVVIGIVMAIRSFT